MTRGDWKSFSDSKMECTENVGGGLPPIAVGQLQIS
ncbi:hypothetical protein QFZ45_001620 [Pseudomonas synxantha]|nr:hypothetical protein [Pseudomonas synxantha]